MVEGERRDFDGSLKGLALESDVLARLFAGADFGALLPSEFNEVENRRADMVARLSDGGVLHVEIQVDLPPALGWRMVNYRRLIRRHVDGSADLHQGVLYVGDAPARAERLVLEDGQLSYAVPLLDIGALSPDIFLASPRFDDAVLAVLTRAGGRDPSVVLNLAERIMPLEGKARADAVSKLAVTADLRRLSDWILGALPMPIAVDFERNAFFRQAVEYGRVQMLREVVRDSLSARGLGKSPALQDAIEAADEGALKHLMNGAATADSDEALLALLTQSRR
ncbi:hypothetical protein C882_3475 [Caenispirillum salinarum AK4]|uniref:Uncharacterized protein n=1 Tax=Caenispirillum salinarum AK4 TaxID=1238182 RepID=K9H0H1_9PROT|nr:hypothetical protein [Caenispirillum salinarum]EKV31725.1 hypothetical protein C882_3475 [Caenispirillum salinarum AK4]